MTDFRLSARPANVMPLSPGERLGPYEIVNAIGAGGMGEVFKARDTRLDRFIAIKVLHADRLADPKRKLRFIQEAKAASALNHPGIVTIYDIGDQNGVSYIAMEFVEGKTLEALTPRDGLRISDALRYAVQAADALSKAHAAGIVHRDLKPNNIMVTDDGLVKILDFGLAKLATPPSENALAETCGADSITRTLAPVTREGTLVGTAPYMSPEQAEGRPVEARSDIFSFGAVLYEMATGKSAFRGDTHLATLSAVLRDDPKPPSQLRDGVPAELQRIILRCLRKDPARRFQTAADLKVALQELLEEFQSGTLFGARPAINRKRTSWPRWAPWVVLAALPLCMAGGWWLGKRSAEVESVGQAVPLTSYPGTELQPSFSPDGNQVAFVWSSEKQDNYDVYVKLVGAGAPLRLTTDPGLDFSPKWSPDGSLIAFARRTAEGNAVMLIPALGGPERRLTIFRRMGMPFVVVSWSPDSKWLAVSGADEGPFKLHIVSTETGEARVLTRPPATSVGDVDPAFSPDGRLLAFSRNLGLNVQEIWTLPLSRSLEPSAEPRRIATGASYANRPSWTANGRELVFAAGVDLLSSIYRIPSDGSEPSHRIASLGDGVSDPAVAPNGRRLAFSRSFRNSLIWRLDTRTGSAEPFIASTFREAFPQYSPDGTRIVFYSNRTGVNQIWVCNADGTGASQLTFMKGTTTGTPRWAPDGKRILFDSNATGKWQIYTMNAGGGRPTQLTNDDFTNVVGSWSRDGKSIYCTSQRKGREEIIRIPSEGGTPVQVTQGGGSGAVESFDGKTVYFTRSKGGRFTLLKMPVGGGEAVEVVKSLHRYNFALTAKGVYYDTPSLPNSPSQIEYLEFATGNVRTLYKLNKPVDLGIAVSPDQRYVLFAQRDFEGSDLMLVDNFQ